MPVTSSGTGDCDTGYMGKSDITTEPGNWSPLGGIGFPLFK